MKILLGGSRFSASRAVGVGFVAVTLVGVTVAALPASGAGGQWDQAATWRLNEGGEASVAKDSSGHHLDASIGSQVVTGLESGRRTYVRFPSSGLRKAPNTGRLLMVGDKSRLDPRSGRFRVVVALRTRTDYANVVQKGQASSAGGYWKLEINDGRAVCLFRGGEGAQAGVGSIRRVDDGGWHKIVCTRFAHRAVMRVDGQVTSIRHKGSGHIDNSRPLSIGGKVHCGSPVDCDFYVGAIDYVRISR